MQTDQSLIKPFRCSEVVTIVADGASIEAFFCPMPQDV